MILLSLLLAIQAETQPRLSDNQIDQVIAYAQTADGVGGARCYATDPQREHSDVGGGFAVSLEGPAGRIFDAVKTAQKSGRTFTRANVTPEMAAMTLTVLAYPGPPSPNGAPPLRPTSLVVRANEITVRPRGTRVVLLKTSTGSGLTVTGRGLNAMFAYEDFARVPPGGFEVAIVANERQWTCAVDAIARASIR
jgi:hypothetical protein